MGNEDPWFIAALGVVALVLVAAAIFLPTKFVQLLIRAWRDRFKR